MKKEKKDSNIIEKRKMNLKKEKNKNIKVKKERKIDNTFRTPEVIFLLIVTCVVSLVMGFAIFHNGNFINNKFSTDENLNEFIENYNYILENYYEDIDSETLLNGAVDGMLSVLNDEYSTSINSDDTNSFNVRLQGNYEGIGIEIINDENNNNIIYSVIEDTPAEKAGLKAGDIIKKIDELNLENQDVSTLSDYVLNNPKEDFKMVVVRDGEEKEFELRREYITLKSVTSKTFEKNNKKIGYIYISIFSSITDNQFKEELEKLETEKIDSLIIDIRDNSGGHLTSVENIMSLFFDSNHVIYQTETKDGRVKKYSKGSKTKKYPIVILQNQNSASASEMLSATLKEEYGATVVGMKSYGKGTVQELITLTNGKEFKFTTKKWLTPKGNWINGVGVEPDIEIELNEEYYNNPSDENDNQLNKAIEYLSEK